MICGFAHSLSNSWKYGTGRTQEARTGPQTPCLIVAAKLFRDSLAAKAIRNHLHSLHNRNKNGGPEAYLMRILARYIKVRAILPYPKMTQTFDSLRRICLEHGKNYLSKKRRRSARPKLSLFMFSFMNKVAKLSHLLGPAINTSKVHELQRTAIFSAVFFLVMVVKMRLIKSLSIQPHCLIAIIFYPPISADA